MKTCFTVVFMLLVAGWAVQAFATSYTSIDLGNLRGYSLNDNGQVAGFVVESNQMKAVIREVNGTYTYVPTLMNGSSDSFAFSISNTGYVVGMCGPEAFRWDGNSMPQRLEGQGRKDAPEAVNDSGIAVGWSDVNNVQRAVRWNADASLTIIPESDMAFDINNAGQIIGSGSRGYYLWDGSADFEYLNFRAIGINNDGWIVGSDYNGRIVLRKPDGNIDVIEAPSGLSNWSAVDINDAGQILAHSYIPGNNYLIIIRNPDGSILNLGMGLPIALNNRGEVLCEWHTDSQNGALLQPVPEPSSLLTLGLAASGVGVGVLRRRKIASSM